MSGIPTAKPITHHHFATDGDTNIGPFLRRTSAEYVVRCRTSVLDSQSARGLKVSDAPWKVVTKKANN